ncbi:MAG: hypothetical protein CO108_13650 [Deltaproteobacteria bacterium CG_4_9_14_3_um_filter_63_12]|nr:MAG: hypothetical protein CO108_13650 [Deltaproteobacteria bacterium CG_4_9_14_3_um_filter_63_12]
MMRPFALLLVPSLLSLLCGACADDRGTASDATAADIQASDTSSVDTQNDTQVQDTSDTQVNDTQTADLPADTTLGDTSTDLADTQTDLTIDVTVADATDTTNDTVTDVADDFVVGPCTLNGFDVAAQAASGELGYVDFASANVASVPFDRLSIETLLDVIPALPYVFDFNGENYKTCTTCVTIQTNQGCTVGPCESKRFLAYEGRLEVTTWDVPAAGAQFEGSLTNIKAVEITLAGGLDFTSTPVSGGEVWCIDTMSFGTELMPF